MYKLLHHLGHINKIYEVKVPIKHAELSNDENKDLYLQILVSGKEFNKE